MSLIVSFVTTLASTKSVGVSLYVVAAFGSSPLASATAAFAAYSACGGMDL